MSKYTTELRFICESLADEEESKGYNSIAQIIESARVKIFDFTYPLFDANYKSVFETKILKHFYTQEIGFETYGRWKLALDAKLNEIMPYYNKLYETELLEFNPFYDFKEITIGDRSREDNTIEHRVGETGNTGTVKDNNTSTSTDKGKITDTLEGNKKDSGAIIDSRVSNSQDGGQDISRRQGGDSFDRWDKYSDTPQGSITDLANDRYLTNARHITENHTGTLETNTTTYGKTNDTEDNNTRILDTNEATKNTNTKDVNTTNIGTNENTRTLNTKVNDTQLKDARFNNHLQYLETVEGKSKDGKSYSKLLLEYRETFLNIDMMIIDELSELFMQLW